MLAIARNIFILFSAGLILLLIGCMKESCEDLVPEITPMIEREYGLVEEIINIKDTTDHWRTDDILSPSNPYVTAKDAVLICEGEAIMVFLRDLQIEFWKATGKDGEVYAGATVEGYVRNTEPESQLLRSILFFRR